MGVIIFNNTKSTDFGIRVSEPPAYTVAKKRYRSIPIPGRNGELHIDEDAYENVERIYKCSFLSNGDRANNSFPAVSSAVSDWLGSTHGYFDLEDSYEPDYYRIARYVEELDITNLDMRAGTFELKFDCLPQRFLKTGRFSIHLNSGDKVQNPTGFSAKPVIGLKAKGTAWIRVGEVRLNFTLPDDDYTEVIIDSEMQVVYNDEADLGEVTSITGEKFPLLQNGDTEITFSGVQSAAIVPNWWTL